MTMSSSELEAPGFDTQDGRDPLPSLSIRIDLPEGRIGPGKIELLEHISTCGSVSAAGRAMGISENRAFHLVAEINGLCATAAVQLRIGGKKGGGAFLTPFGKSLVANYRKIVRCVESVARDELIALRVEMCPLTSSARPQPSLALPPASAGHQTSE
jgi:molybdate transport system regulatory protein